MRLLPRNHGFGINWQRSVSVPISRTVQASPWATGSGLRRGWICSCVSEVSHLPLRSEAGWELKGRKKERQIKSSYSPALLSTREAPSQISAQHWPAGRGRCGEAGGRTDCWQLWEQASHLQVQEHNRDIADLWGHIAASTSAAVTIRSSRLLLWHSNCPSGPPESNLPYTHTVLHMRQQKSYGVVLPVWQNVAKNPVDFSSNTLNNK